MTSILQSAAWFLSRPQRVNDVRPWKNQVVIDLERSFGDLSRQYVHIEPKGFDDVASVMLSSSVVREDMSPQKKHWMVTLQEVFYPALAAVGIPSNTITFLIILRRNCMISKSSTFYLMAMSVADNLVLIFIVVLELSLKYHQQDLFWSYEPWCNLRDIFNYGAYNASTWLVVVFTVERFIAIHTWKIKTKICTPKCAAWTIAAIFLFSHVFAIPYYWSNASVYKNNRTSCIYRPEASSHLIHTLVWFQTLQAYIFPFLIILTLNGLTLRLISLCNRVHVATDLTSGVKRVTPLLRSRKRKSVVLLVTVSMTFVLLSVTRAITQIILRTTHLYTLDRNDYNLQINIAADAGTMLSLSNAAANMYLYVCTQSKFRQELYACVRQVSLWCKTKL